MLFVNHHVQAMLSRHTEIELAQLLKAIAHYEKQIEAIKQILAENKSFDSYSAFNTIDVDRVGYIDARDLQLFLEQKGVSASNEEIIYLVHLFSQNKDQFITYSDFLDMILPATYPLLDESVTQRQTSFTRKEEELPYDLAWYLSRIFEKEISSFHTLQALKQGLVKRSDLDVIDAFKLLDNDKMGSLDRSHFHQVFKRNNIIVSEEDVSALLRRIDKDRDGRVSLSDFAEAVSPIQSIPKLSYPLHQPKPMSRSLPIETITQRKHRAYEFDPTDLSLSESQLLERSRDYKTPPRRSSGNKRSPQKPRISPLKRREEETLAKILKEQIGLESNIESLRRELAMKSSFSTLDAFKFFDIDGKGFISCREFEDMVLKIGVYPSTEELCLIMKKYDKDRDGLLR